MPSSTAIVYRVSYHRDSWKPDSWKNKLFNSEAAARRYADNLVKPVTADTPEKFRNLSPVRIQLSCSLARWGPVDDVLESGPRVDEWTPALQNTRRVMIKTGVCSEDVTLERVIEFKALMEEQE